MFQTTDPRTLLQQRLDSDSSRCCEPRCCDSCGQDSSESSTNDQPPLFGDARKSSPLALCSVFTDPAGESLTE